MHAARHRQQDQRRGAISPRLGAARTGLATQMSNSAAYEGGSVPPDDDEEDWDAANADAGTGTGTEENSEAESYETEDELNDDVRWPCAISHAQLDLGESGSGARYWQQLGHGPHTALSATAFALDPDALCLACECTAACFLFVRRSARLQLARQALWGFAMLLACAQLHVQTP